MDTTWYIIANPAAGAGAVARKWPQIESVLQELGFSYTVRFTESRGHAIRLVEDAVLKGHRYFMGIGGDGTNHEIANGILQQNVVPSAHITYALMPVGTGNDWARTYRIPHDPRARLLRLLEGQTVLQDAGLVRYEHEGQLHERYFVNVAGMAYDAFIAWKMDVLPRRPSKWQYLLLVARYVLEYQLNRARIVFDQQTAEDFFYTINVGICRYSGGGMQLVPHADPADGLLALTFARKLPKWEVLAQTPRFYKGTLIRHPKVSHFQVKNVQVTQSGDTPTLLEADGEFLGHTPATFSIVAKALKIAL